MRNFMYISSNKERCVQMATYMIENESTVRGVAKKFGISKSTVHKDITVNLKRINPELYLNVKKILNINKQERHLRGGEATKQKFLNAKQNT
ncbi:MAG: sporulation transcriptional regulator SpoIIID [Clostridia bacterium]|nr:sporulation transcriptional regulator SpoIIID [Clostridia bacterium]